MRTERRQQGVSTTVAVVPPHVNRVEGLRLLIGHSIPLRRITALAEQLNIGPVPLPAATARHDVVDRGEQAAESFLADGEKGVSATHRTAAVGELPELAASTVDRPLLRQTGSRAL